MAQLLHEIMESFERLLRWVYPGLLFWASLPLAIIPSSMGWDEYASFYKSVSAPAQAALVVTAGFVFYLLERYIVNDLLMWVLYAMKVGAAYNFRDVTDRKWRRGFPRALGHELWVRFGLRLGDGVQPKEDAEVRFDGYLMSRWASIHSLGTTWAVAVVIIVIGSKQTGSLLSKLSQRLEFPYWLYWIFVSLVIAGWVYAAVLAERAEEPHYK